MKLNDDRPVIWDSFGIANRYSGIGRHAWKLCHALQENQYYPLICSLGASSLPKSNTLYFKTYLPQSFLSSKLGWLSGQRELFRLLSGFRHDFVFHGLCNFNLVFPPLARCFKVLTVHDVIPFSHPSAVSALTRYQLKWLMPKALTAADRVIVVSQWTRDLLAEAYPHVSSKLVVIPNGFPKRKVSALHEQGFSKGSLRGLSVMRYEPYKRFSHLVGVLRACSVFLTVKLVTDERGFKWCSENAGDLIRSGKLEVSKHVSDHELDELYKWCDFLLHTSEVEGYCLPACEALSHGKTVVYQSGSGIDDVIGPCGWPLDSGASLDGWIDVVMELRERLIKDGKSFSQHVDQQSSWSDVARLTGKLYNS